MNSIPSIRSKLNLCSPASSDFTSIISSVYFTHTTPPDATSVLLEGRIRQKTFTDWAPLELPPPALVLVLPADFRLMMMFDNYSICIVLKYLISPLKYLTIYLPLEQFVFDQSIDNIEDFLNNVWLEPLGSIPNLSYLSSINTLWWVCYNIRNNIMLNLTYLSWMQFVTD